MLAVISPAKSLNYDPVPNGTPSSLPEFQDDATRLARTAKQLPLKGLRQLMSISDDLARLNKARFQAFEPASTPQNSKQAALAFNGDTYQGLEAWTMSDEELEYSQEHLRILSGLYGLLRPMDLIQPYRLEMGSRLKTRRGTNLYAYWGDQLAKAVDDAAQGAPVINLASSEYFKAAKPQKLKSQLITCSFKEEKDNGLQMVGFFAKNARGAMARYIIQNRVDQLDGLKDFDTNGYRFRADLSDESNFVFSRPSVT